MNGLLSPRPISSFLAVLFAATFMLASYMPAQSAPAAGVKKRGVLTLSAKGEVDSKPDIATINTGIETEAVQAREALDDNNEIMDQILKSLKARGIDEKDIATTQFSVQPRYQSYKTGRSRKIIGYRVVNSLRVVVRDLGTLGPTLDRLVTLGSNRIGQINFGLSDPETAANLARKEAIRMVMEKAQLYSQAANVQLAEISSIREQTSRYRPRSVGLQSFSRKKRASIPVAAGQMTTSITVHMSWRLEN